LTEAFFLKKVLAPINLPLKPMHKYRFHDKWVLPILVLLYFSTNLLAQCPDTKSANYAMLPQGIPFYVPLQPSDFQVQPEDSSIFSNLTLSKGHFTCGDIGIQEVFLSGITAANESFSCGVNVWVYDSVRLCGDTIITPRAIGGKILTEKNEAVPNIAIGLSSGSVNYFRGSDESGHFYFENFELENYNLRPDYPFENNVRNGVSTLDVLFLQKHVLGLKKFDSPYQIIAADVNSSGEITAYDMLLLRQLILSVIDEFPNTPSWKFIDASFVFDEEIDPLLQEIPTSISLDMTKLGPQLDNRFIAVKIGDLNNSVNFGNAAQGRSTQVNSSPIFSLNNDKLTKGAVVEIPFTIAQNITTEGLQFSLEYDESKLTFVDITSELAISDNNYLVKDGVLTFSWTATEQVSFAVGEVPFKFTFIAKESGLLVEAIGLTKKPVAAEIYSNNFTVIPFSIDWQKSINTNTFQSFDNYPNPFSTHTTIPFYLPQSSTILLQIFDANGRIVLEDKKFFDAGFQDYQLEKGLAQSGLYFYRLESINGIASGRMNYIE